MKRCVVVAMSLLLSGCSAYNRIWPLPATNDRVDIVELSVQLQREEIDRLCQLIRFQQNELLVVKRDLREQRMEELVIEQEPVTRKLDELSRKIDVFIEHSKMDEAAAMQILQEFMSKFPSKRPKN